MRARWRRRSGAGADVSGVPEAAGPGAVVGGSAARAGATGSAPGPTGTASDAGPGALTAPAIPESADVEPATSATPASPSRTPTRWARLLGPEVAGPVVAVAIVVNVVLVVAPSFTGSADSEKPGGRRDGPPASSTYAPGAHGGGDEKGGARELLARVADTAERARGLRPRDGEFTYVRSKSAETADPGDRSACAVVEPLRERRLWRSVDGSRAGLLRGDRFPGERVRLEPDPPGPTSTAFRHLQRLPRDPAALLRTLRAAEPRVRPGDQQVFRTVGDMLAESVLPPATEAALYRAAARIPGVVVIHDAVDAVGRRGVAVARVDEATGERAEWLFGRQDLRLLGVRVVVVDPEKTPRATGEDCDGPKAGAVTSTTAVVDRAVVARPGDQPGGRRGAGRAG
ncbi:CU044_5270 family protein [Streptomyces sp. NPDC057702]|uniref:CU044_5270 family protein n=1 Tax=unclassified Streptomyces TaxID=2593676 RepID=UPI0036AA1508